eukprot:TRINITY_DN15072_c0_g1_i5.p1 TRINITY_DN15072_c0_g1~~TRINITY_DN15072_c0_g1_i5.p1  ORF type:complete len:394 (-),score=59.57 TRINITY_DN15072_c0_g1_i5:111-1292(-)
MSILLPISRNSITPTPTEEINPTYHPVTTTATEEEAEGFERDDPFAALARSTREDLSRTTEWVELQIPYTCLFLLLWISNFFTGLVVYFVNTIVLGLVNWKIKSLIHRGSFRCLPLLCCGVILLVQISLTLLVYRDSNFISHLLPLSYPTFVTGNRPNLVHLDHWGTGVGVGGDINNNLLEHNNITFTNSDSLYSPSFTDCLWIIAMNDLIVRSFTCALKCFSITTFGSFSKISYIKWEQLFLIMDAVSQTYRSFLPSPIWIPYLLDETNVYLASRLVLAIYLLLKISATRKHVLNVIHMVVSYHKEDTEYGHPSSPEELESSGERSCPICRDEFMCPLSLPCKHIFCEDCVLGWFRQEKTCPLCRRTANKFFSSSFDRRSFLDSMIFSVEIF